jgi:hypothetical protein
MSRDSTVIAFRQPDDIDDLLTELAREGARRMLASGADCRSRRLRGHVKRFEVAGWSRPHPSGKRGSAFPNDGTDVSD